MPIREPAGTATCFWVLYAWLCGSVLAAGPRVEIVVGAEAPMLEREAAVQLKAQLERLYQAEVSVAHGISADTRHVILLGSPKSNPTISTLVSAWPALSEQGHVLRSLALGPRQALVVGGGSPAATYWAACELGQRWGIRYFLYDDLFPVTPPPFTLAGHDAVLEPIATHTERAWPLHAESPLGTATWGLDEQRQLLRQLAKLKFNRVTLASAQHSVPPIRVDGDTAGRAAFRGAKQFQSPDVSRAELAAVARALGMDVAQPSVESTRLRVLPVAGIAAPAPAAVPVGQVGDLDLVAHHLSRAAFGGQLTPESACQDLVTPVCGEEVSTRVTKAFQFLEQATALGKLHDPEFGAPSSTMLMQHFRNEPAPAWWSEARDAYLNAMNEMYRANTRAREGSRSYTLYHARRSEFAFQYMNSLLALRRAGIARAKPDPEATLTELEASVEAMYGALNALAAVARSSSDRATIALLNEYAYRPLKRELESAEQSESR